MKITPTRVVLQCQICDGPREFNYFHALKAHFEGNHSGKELMFKKRVIKGKIILMDFNAYIYSSLSKKRAARFILF